MTNENNTMTRDQELKLAEIFRPQIQNETMAIQKVNSFLKHPDVRQIADIALINALESNKIDINYTVKTRKKVVEQGFKKNNLSAVNSALDRLEDHLGLNNKVKVTETREVNSNLASNFDNAVKETKKITIETTENGGKDSKKPVNNEEEKE